MGHTPQGSEGIRSLVTNERIPVESACVNTGGGARSAPPPVKGVLGRISLLNLIRNSYSDHVEQKTAPQNNGVRRRCEILASPDVFFLVFFCVFFLRRYECCNAAARAFLARTLTFRAPLMTCGARKAKIPARKGLVVDLALIHESFHT